MNFDELQKAANYPTLLYPSIYEINLPEDLDATKMTADNYPFKSFDSWFVSHSKVQKEIPKFIEKKSNQVCKFWLNGICNKVLFLLIILLAPLGERL